jgi:hypothetical protein
VRLALEVVGAQGPAGADGPKGPAGPPPVRLVDARERDVGPAVSVEWYLAASKDLLEGAPVIHVLVQPAALAGPAFLGVDYSGKPVGTVYYASADCTGPPMVSGGFFLPVLQAVGDAVFVPGLPANITIAHSNESSNFSPGCVAITPRGGCCKAVTGIPATPLEATATTLGALGMAPPFRAVGP